MTTSYTESSSGAVVLTPEKIQKLEDLLVSSVVFTGEFPKQSPACQIAVILSDKTEDALLTSRDVLAYPNSKLRAISAIEYSTGLGFEPRIRLAIGERGWTVVASGETVSVQTFRKRFAETISGVKPWYSVVAKLSGGELFVGILGAIGLWSIVERFFESTDKAPSSADEGVSALSLGQYVSIAGIVLLLLGLAGIALSVVFDAIRVRVFPLFVCTVGDGSSRYRNQASSRKAILGTLATVVIGIFINRIS